MIGKDIHIARRLLQQGKAVAIPTETVYGLAANALDPEAVVQIFGIKNRPTFDPLIVHSHSLEAIQGFVKAFPQKAAQLAKAFWPGPLTLVLPKQEIIPDLVSAGLDTVAVRIPAHPLTLELLSSLDFPLAAPSANPFGYVSPTLAQHVAQQLGDRLEYILDGGPCQVGLESTIIGFDGETPLIYRLGGTSQEAITEVVGGVDPALHSGSNPKAPGMMNSHYAPHKKLLVYDSGMLQKKALSAFDLQKTGFLAFQEKHPEIPEENQFVLSLQGDLSEAARNLFAGLRFLDNLELDRILAEWVPDIGLGKAINDRIRRAAF